MVEAEAPWTIRRLLEWTTPFFTRKEVDSPRLCAELLLSHVLGMPRIKLYTNYEKIVGPKELAAYRELVRRASEHEPVAYLTGKAHFFNLEFEVSRDVLIPRPETETLVENVMQLIRNAPGLEAARILDLCTGSGCVAGALAYHVKQANVVATDISAAAVATARKNIERLGLAQRVAVEEGDLFEALANMVDRQPFDVIVSNPPYIPSNQIPTLPRNVREYEPIAALDGGMDGLMIHRRILREGSDRLKAGGHLLLEIAFDQGELALQVAAEYPAFGEARILKDHAGHSRVLAARKM